MKKNDNSLKGRCESLNHLTSHGTNVVQTQHLLVAVAHRHRLQITIPNALLRHKEFRRLVVGVQNFHIIGSVSLDSLLFAQTNGSVFQRRKHRRGHIVVVHLLRGTAKDPTSQQTSGQNGNRRQFGTRLQHIADGENVRNVGCLVRVDVQLVAALALYNAGVLQLKVFGERISTDGKEHRVEDLGHLTAIVEGVHDLESAVGGLLDGLGLALEVELDALLDGGIRDHLGHLLVEAAEHDGAHQDGRVVAETVQEAGALETNV